jgi:hypothetical protein
MGIAILERALESAGLVKDLLEPEFIDLVDDNEEHLVVFGTVGNWTLGGQEFFEMEVFAVGESHAAIITLPSGT